MRSTMCSAVVESGSKATAALALMRLTAASVTPGVLAEVRCTRPWQAAHVHARRTDQVLIDLINGAKRSLVLVTYSLSMYAELKTALRNALDRGVNVTVLAEDPQDGPPQFTKDPAVALAGLLVRRLRWPKDQRPAGWTSLHAKRSEEHTS